MITLYQQHDSGNCYKVRLILSHLGRAFRVVAVSSLDGSTRKPEFLAMNPIGKIPTVELDDGRFLAESNAIPSAAPRRRPSGWPSCSPLAIVRLPSWNNGWLQRNGLLEKASPSPTSRSMPIRIWRMRAVSISLSILGSVVGCHGFGD